MVATLHSQLQPNEVEVETVAQVLLDLIAELMK